MSETRTCRSGGFVQDALGVNRRRHPPWNSVGFSGTPPPAPALPQYLKAFQEFSWEVHAGVVGLPKANYGVIVSTQAVEDCFNYQRHSRSVKPKRKYRRPEKHWGSSWRAKGWGEPTATTQCWTPSRALGQIATGGVHGAARSRLLAAREGLEHEGFHRLALSWGFDLVSEGRRTRLVEGRTFEVVMEPIEVRMARLCLRRLALPLDPPIWRPVVLRRTPLGGPSSAWDSGGL